MQPWIITERPEQAGISSKAILNYLDAVKESGLEHHCVMIAKDGMLAATLPFGEHTKDEAHVMFSVSKSFTSMAAGFAVEEGLLSLDSRVLDVLSDLAPENPDEWLKTVTLHHLLCMGSGLCQRTDNIDHVFHPNATPENWAQTVLSIGCDAEPGTRFRYNSHGSYLIACMVQRVTGQTLVDYLMPRLFEPLGIERPRWDMSPQGVCCGGWGLYLSCENLLKFGLCLLNDGVWQGRQVLPRAWLSVATQAQIDTEHRTPAPTIEWAQGYCYHFWRCTGNRFRADGSGGQYCIVSPDQRMVVAVTAELDDMAKEHALLNEHIFSEASQALPSTEEDFEELVRRLASLPIAKKEA